MKHIVVLAVALTVLFPLAAQDAEMSVEESYLQESVENMIIREQSRADSREMKLIALAYIGDAISRGNTSNEVREALEYLGLEGVLNRGRENGRLVNNFPDVRREAVKYLGQMGTVEARDALLKIIYYDNETMVLQEAVKSLADINVENGDNAKTISTIAWIVQKFDNTNPDNLLALSAVEAFEKLGASGGGLKDPNAIQMLIRIAEGPYVRPVQDRAKAALSNIRLNQAQAARQQQQQRQQQ
ncbi:MAG: HEAT repeat domain-containing protein [Treponema sp.]|jgi:HEAT repeat protein|nr:HEAT repeat domain-containing protein [Treponema sp.]